MAMKDFRMNIKITNGEREKKRAHSAPKQARANI